ncbi:uncharacterized protein LOC143035289 isoform X2 [Oratosquilla oratoria]|uniref:uncharacterized protein LOC143035289 isoform X2 n=1 Tax=Oratosquilla oratoria TaxID=337810 RepID=UPI003F764808
MEEVDLSDNPAPALEDEAPDPRIQVELEQLNSSTDAINKLEVDLDEARNLFRQLLTDSTQRIDALAKRLGKCVEQSRPYYDARIKAKQALAQAQAAAVRYERAMSQHAAAREMVFLAEEGLMQKGCVFDQTWQEMLNHATTKVNDAEKEKVEATVDHRRTSAHFHEAETRVKALQKELKRAIAKSRPYFELKAAMNQQLELQKQRVKQLEEQVAAAKLDYSQALANLETISDEIHKVRIAKTQQCQLDLGVRGVGVGAESPLPPHTASDSELGSDRLSSQIMLLDDDSEGDEFMNLPEILTPASVTLIGSQVQSTDSSEFLVPAIRSPSSEQLSVSSRQSGTQITTTPYSFSGIQPFTVASTFIAGSTLSSSGVISTSASTKVTDIKTVDTAQIELEGEVEKTVVKEVEVTDGGAASSDLSGWQVVGLQSGSNASSHYLTVDDRDSVISDTESLASIEMLSDEAIMGLMLEEELMEASQSICTPVNTPVIESCKPSLQPTAAHQSSSAIETATHSLLNLRISGQPSCRGSSASCLSGVKDRVFLCKKEDNCGDDSDCEEEKSDLNKTCLALDLDSSSPLFERKFDPPKSLTLSAETPSDPSSPEAITPGYAPLRDTPNSPDDDDFEFDSGTPLSPEGKQLIRLSSQRGDYEDPICTSTPMTDKAKFMK